MADPVKTEANPNSAPATATPSPATNPASAGDTFALPQELAGKSVEEVGRYYAERYKDYDDLKTRAGAWDGIDRKPEDVKSSLDLYEKITGALRSGKALRLDDKGQILADAIQRAAVAQQDAQRGTPAADDNGDWLENWELVDPRDQARRLETRWNQSFDKRIEAKEKQYGELIENRVGQAFKMLDTALNLIAECQEHPELRIRDVLKRAADVGVKNPGIDPIRAAIDEVLSPGMIEAKAKERAAAIVAEERAKAEKERAEKNLASGTARSGLMNFMRNGNERVTRDEIIANLRRNGLTE